MLQPTRPGHFYLGQAWVIAYEQADYARAGQLLGSMKALLPPPRPNSANNVALMFDIDLLICAAGNSAQTVDWTSLTQAHPGVKVADEIEKRLKVALSYFRFRYARRLLKELGALNRPDSVRKFETQLAERLELQQKIFRGEAPVPD